MPKPHFLLCDLDGVIIKKDLFFSDRFSDTYRIPNDAVQAFFKTDFPSCLNGTRDLKEALTPYLTHWGVTLTADEIVRFWFSHETSLNDELLEKIQELRKNGTHVYIATNNEKYRAEYIWNTLGLCNQFDGIFASGKIGFVKPDPAFWNAVWHALQQPDKKTVAVWDDNTENIASASAFGFNATLIETVHKRFTN